jgi:hypothetical protein
VIVPNQASTAATRASGHLIERPDLRHRHLAGVNMSFEEVIWSYRPTIVFYNFSLLVFFFFFGDVHDGERLWKKKEEKS